MKLSTRSRYGLKAMCIIAKEDDGEKFIPINFIAKEISVQEKYLEQIIALLKKSELIISNRGQAGGYRLNRAAKDITVGDILRVLEDDLEIVDCIKSGCEKNKKCIAYDVWYKLYMEINKFLDGISLQSLIDGEDKK